VHGLGVPEYVVKDSGPDHQKLFRAVVRVGSRELGSGEGRSKKAAEQLAAEAAWRAITAEAEQAQNDADRAVPPADAESPLPGADGTPDEPDSASDA
jgi:ribonuclease-3